MKLVNKEKLANLVELVNMVNQQIALKAEPQSAVCDNVAQG